jgi:hypothetical protein
MDIRRYCTVKDFNWEALTELNARLKKFEIEVETVTCEVYWFPDRYTMDSVDNLLHFVKKKGNPRDYTISFRAKRNDTKLSISISRGRNFSNEEYLVVSVSNVENDIELNSILSFLNLEAEEKLEHQLAIDKSVFIAYRFDEVGENLAFKLSRFLELLGFSVTSGRTYSPKKISEKVEERIAKQSLFFVILTKGNDNTWLNQEPTLAKSQNKPVFLLKDTEYDYTSGIFSDQEFIPFHLNSFEKTFIQILEGLRELKLLN